MVWTTYFKLKDKCSFCGRERPGYFADLEYVGGTCRGVTVCRRCLDHSLDERNKNLFYVLVEHITKAHLDHIQGEQQQLAAARQQLAAQQQQAADLGAQLANAVLQLQEPGPLGKLFTSRQLADLLVRFAHESSAGQQDNFPVKLTGIKLLRHTISGNLKQATDDYEAAEAAYIRATPGLNGSRPVLMNGQRISGDVPPVVCSDR